MISEEQQNAWDRYILSVKQGKDARVESESRKEAILAVALDYELVKVELAEAKRRLQFERERSSLRSAMSSCANNYAKISICNRFVEGKIDLVQFLNECQELLEIDEDVIKKHHVELSKKFPNWYQIEFGKSPQEKVGL